MENPRFLAVSTSGLRNSSLKQTAESPVHSENFGSKVFNRSVMHKALPKKIYDNIIDAIEGRDKIKEEFADAIALAMKEWAISMGATHFCHWFQPLTGMSAEKHDAFIEWNYPEGVIEKFSGKQLVQGEPDASSFPHGGLRSTFEARGYTGWDPSSPVFLWAAGDGVTLCIPSVYFSWTGAVLDSKIPLLRSEKKVNDATLRMLKLTGIEASHVISTLGVEQEYFVIDRALRNLRPDLVLLGKTVVGAESPKGQELQDHYFGSVKDRILSFMQDFEKKAIELGIPVKTRHNEVAPAQHEVAPVFEKSSLAVDHNILLMELMRQVALHHNLSCLLHEKPFQGLNGSGKHCNWSLSTNTGINLLNPTDTPENNLHFLILLTACLYGVHRHSKLMRTSVGSAGNDFRLGGHEAPPAIISVYLGGELDELLKNIESATTIDHKDKKGKFDFGLNIIPELSKDNTDRNRTSPFAFTGNKFEFRALGSSMSPALAITTINLIVAEGLNAILDDIDTATKGALPSSEKELIRVVLPVLQKYLIASKNVRFEGDNYSKKWIEEAGRRGLPNIEKSIYAFDTLKCEKTIKLFEGILTADELASRYEVMVETYAHVVNIEAKLLNEIFKTQVLPASIKDQQTRATSIVQTQKLLGDNESLQIQKNSLIKLSSLISSGIRIHQEFERLREHSESLDLFERAKELAEGVIPLTKELRAICDELEKIVDDSLWPLPKYRELLYMI